MDERDYTGAWDYRSLPANVRLGPGCWIERRESFRRYRSTQPVGLALGAHVTVYMWTEFSIEPEASVEVGDDSVLVGAIIMCAQRVTIGRRVVVSYHVTIADSDFHPLDPAARRLDAIANAPGGDLSRRPRVEAKPIVVDDDAWIGIGAYILKGVHIGRGARIEAGAVVSRDVAPGAVIAGNPGRDVGKATPLSRDRGGA
jgi:acetyltransferase-like isoleucine patch superfamily enzyme